jgi:hypothetical protein
MATRRRFLGSLVLGGLTLAACGDGEPPPPPPPAAAPAQAAPANRVPVVCIAKWTSGASATFACTASGPSKDRVKVDKETLRLDKICVNDPQLTSYGFDGGQTAALTLVAEGNARCASLGGVKRLPETCTCVPSAAGACAPPQEGFVCIVLGHIPLDAG